MALFRSSATILAWLALTSMLVLGADAQETAPALAVPVAVTGLSPMERSLVRALPDAETFGSIVLVPSSDWGPLYQSFVSDPDADPNRLIEALSIQTLAGRQMDGLQRVVPTTRARGGITNLLNHIKTVCAGSPACEQENGVPELITALRSLHSTPMACQQATTDFDPFQRCSGAACRTPDAIAAARAYDAACQYEPGTLVKAGGRVDPAQPAVFVQDSQGKSALDVVAFIRIDAQGRQGHRCGGLITPRGILTARHCIFGDGDLRPVLAAGGLVAVRVSDGKPFMLARTTQVDRRASNVADDYLLLPYAAGQIAPSPPPTRIAAPTRPGPATVVGFWPHYTHTAAPDPSLADLRRGARYPLPTLCHVVAVKSGCVRAVCPTIAGYSGGPVFARDRGPAGELIVLGLVSSGAEGLRCDAPSLAVGGGGPETMSTALSTPDIDL